MAELPSQVSETLVEDIETALRGILKQLIPSAEFKIEKFKRGGKVGLTLTLSGETYPRFIKLGARDLLPLRVTEEGRKYLGLPPLEAKL